MNRPVNIGVSHRIGRYSDAVEIPAGARVLYLSGTPGLDAASGDVPADFAAQAELAWSNVARILEAAGMGIGDIVKVTQHLVRQDDLAAYRPIRAKWLDGHEPASMLTFLPALVWPQMLIELEVVAAKAEPPGDVRTP
jgi:enamine deaminase RidA (YjgF/YER057c/UK114 family)